MPAIDLRNDHNTLTQHSHQPFQKEELKLKVDDCLLKTTGSANEILNILLEQWIMFEKERNRQSSARGQDQIQSKHFHNKLNYKN